MVEEGQKVVIKGVYEGFPDPNVLWLHNQTPVRPSHDIKIEVRNKETSISFTKVSTIIVVVIIKLRQMFSDAVNSGFINISNYFQLESSIS